MQDVLVFAAVVMPSTQYLHALSLAGSANEPAGHVAAHALAASEEYVLAAQAVHDVDPAVE